MGHRNNKKIRNKMLWLIKSKRFLIVVILFVLRHVLFNVIFQLK